MIQLRSYQKKLCTGIATAIHNGNKRVIGQLPTGGGKTVCFSYIVNSFLKKAPEKRVMILVHREELRTQAKKSLKNFFNIEAHEIKAGDRYVPNASVYVGLIQTIRNRVNLIPEIDMLIVDECHLGHFDKIFESIKGDFFIIGFSATPLSASKKDPLKNHYQSIVCGPQIKEIIQEESLAQNYTFAPKIEIDRSKFRKTSLGDFRESDMAEQFAKQKSIITTRKAYEKHSLGKKTIIFNVNIEHSLKVLEEFTTNGYNAKHVDGSTNKKIRKEIFEWFKNTEDAILCNVGIATMGFDEPTINTVIVNRSTTSLPLWLQMTGRGSRITENKRTFKIIDLGANAQNLGDWNADRDWEYIFYHPDKPKEDGIAPVKDCPQCEAILHARVMKCQFCGHIFERKTIEEEKEMLIEDFEMVTKGIVVQKEINLTESKGWKEYTAFFRILNSFAKNYNPKIDDHIKSEMHEKIKLWHNHFGRKYTANRKKFTEDRFNEIIAKL